MAPLRKILGSLNGPSHVIPLLSSVSLHPVTDGVRFRDPGPNTGVLLRRGMVGVRAVRDIRGKPTEMINPVHGNPESEPTTRKTAWDPARLSAHM